MAVALMSNHGVAPTEYTHGALDNSRDFPRLEETGSSRSTCVSSNMNLMLTGNFEEKNVRLASFRKWPENARANPAVLAEAGFYYTGSGAGDTVTCYACKKKINNWNQDMDPLEEHRRQSPDCTVVRRNASRNTNSFPFFSDIPEAQPPSIHQSYMAQTSDDMTVEDNRRSSFSSKPGWPQNVPVKIDDLVKAGFFYTGDRDKVMCAYCRGRLLNWGAGDSAYGEHMRHFPRCSFLERLAKEQEEEEMNRRTAALSITSSESSGGSFQAQGGSGFVPVSSEAVMEIVRNVGVSEVLLAKAVEELKRQGVRDLNSRAILDIVFRLEDESRNAEGGDFESDTAAVMEQSDPRQEQSDSELHPVSVESVPMDTEEPSRPSPETLRRQNKPNSPLSHLHQENKRLKDSTMCRKCNNYPSNVLFLPCRHLGSCDKCANELHECPICKQQVLGTVKTFMS